MKPDKKLPANLRQKLDTLGLAGMVVPHTNAHQSEYLPPADERLLHLTGFTGSAGTAVILANSAAIFVDGRYTIQSRTEVDESIFEICHLGKTSPAKWLRENINTGDRIGFDPWHFTQSQLNALQTAVGEGGGEMIALDENPIDALWRARPTYSTSAIKTQDEKFAGESSREKRKLIAETIKSAGASAQILASGDSISWLFNIRGDDVPFTPLVLGFAIVYADASAKLFVEPERISDDVNAHMGKDVKIISPARLGEELENLKDKIRITSEDTPVWIKRKLESAKIKTVTATDPCSLPKAAKNKAEISGIRQAHIRDGVALTKFLAWLSGCSIGNNLTEMDAAEKLESFRAEDSMYIGPSFPTIAGSGANGAIVHYRVTVDTNRALKSGELFLVDSGGQYPDGTTDVTRTIAIGEPSAEMKDRFTRVLKGHIKLAAQIFPKGTAGQELDVLARLALWQVGLDYDHGTGHGVGAYLSVHEGPQRISKKGIQVALETGMVLSVEPGYYKEGEYGIRIENLVTVIEASAVEKTPDGPHDRLSMLSFDTLTMAPIDKNLIDIDMLENTEIDWLNQYHKKVLKTLKPHLSDEDLGWLMAATSPI